MRLSYEQRNHASIVRSQDNIATYEKDNLLRTIKLTSTGASLDLELLWKKNPQGAVVAIWAETKSGTIIETLHLSESLKYSETHHWENATARRGKTLPVWRHRYTTICGIDPFGTSDSLSQPTLNHQWLLDQKLNEGTESFVLYVEVNFPGDNTPSLIYAANIEPENTNPYTLLNLLAHSGDSETDGELNYDLESLDLDNTPIDRILVKTNWSKTKSDSR